MKIELETHSKAYTVTLSLVSHKAWHLHNGFLLYFFFPANWVRILLLNRPASRNVYKAWKEENVCFPPWSIQSTELRISEFWPRATEENAYDLLEMLMWKPPNPPPPETKDR